MEPPGRAAPALTTGRKVGFALGDHTIGIAFSALGLFFLIFLTDVAGLRPLLASLVVWIARAADAVSDPLMGRVSDLTRWRAGRRRPYLLIGALPFGLFFALLWRVPVEGEAAMFAYYTAVYVGLSLATTVLSVPYMALIPEMATGYDERTSLNTFRAVAAVLGTFAAVGMLALADRLGGDAAAFARTGLLFALWVAVPWLVVFGASFERPGFRPALPERVIEEVRSLARHRTYLRLMAIYIAARIAVDLAGLAFVYFLTHNMGRRGDVYPVLLSLLGVVVLALPVWLAVSRRMDKHRTFVLGTSTWVALLLVLFFVTPEWPRWAVFGLAALSGVGYAVADMMPWAMLGEVIDEDELRNGKRREGVYNGFFTFLRKLGGATAFLLAGALLELTGYREEGPQPESALLAIHALLSLVPASFLAIAIALAARYPLSRARHDAILSQLARR